jgi:hypothetical protein
MYVAATNNGEVTEDIEGACEKGWNRAVVAILIEE